MSDMDAVPSGKKTKDRIQQLSELRRGLVHYTDAQYGTASDSTFVMHIVVDGMVFQGIGPSKKRAKVMASERALAYIGAIEPDMVQMPEPETPDIEDPTADVFTGLMFYSFEAPDVSVADASLKLPFEQPENLDAPEEYDGYTVQEVFEDYIGRNAVSILSEIRPDAQYEILFASCFTNPTRFVTSVRVKGRTYCGDAKSKKVSKGRAAAVALTDLYGIEFKTAEDGMPVYEGSTKVWENYKATLEKEVEMEAAPIINPLNPVERLNELFPEAEFEFPDSSAKTGGFFRAQFTIAGSTYVGVGLNKKDAKANAAANTIEALEKNGQLEQRQAEMEAKRKEKQEKQGNTEKGKQAQEKPDIGALSHIPTVRLQEIYPQAEYQVMGETPLRNTPIRAFVTAVVIEGQSFVGVGKSKKLAKSAAAEKALRALGQWTNEDEMAKKDRLKTQADVVPPLFGVEGFGPIPTDGGIHSLLGQYGASQYGWPARGRGNLGYGCGSRGFHQRGRGRGFAAGFGDQFGGESGELDLMVGELSQLVAQILQTNPNMGVADVWNLLQQNPDYQSWRSGAMASGMQSYYGYQSFDDPYNTEYYGAYEDPYGDYSGYYPAAMSGMGRGANVRSWSRNTAGRGGKKKFQKAASYW